MRKILFTIIIATTIFTATAFAQNKHVPYKFYGIQDPESEKIWNLVDEADIVVGYDHESKLDINIGRVVEDACYPITFELEELELFFGRQKYKNLIVVFFDKLAQLDGEKVEKSIEKLNDYFFKMGYTRVILLQGLGSGVGLYSDKINQIKD